MKKFIAGVSVAIISAFIALNYTYIFRNKVSTYKQGNIKYISKVESKNLYIYKYGKWKKKFINGVNIGAAKPGHFPGELAISKDEYLRWLKYIGEMNADAIRVYTILKPEFYEALYEYNKKSVKPIYIFQGVWVNEEDMAKLMNANDPKIKENFKKDIKDLTDIIHGDAYLAPKKGVASGKYIKDISPYVMGWILGIEWDPQFVISTNELNKGDTNFSGKYLYTKKASPFERVLCEIGDYAVEYETQKYNMQRPVSFTNWVTTDVLKHPNEPLSREELVAVNTESIKAKPDFKPGIFASYHIYPYYPDFMNYQDKYANFKDKDGKINTYRAYLKDLINEHTVPVLVSEFGIPASRGMAHENIHMGFNQGNIDEKTQGNMDAFMLENIYEEGYAGGLVFSWQDEWFKRTWNTMDLDIPDRRPYWSNPQTNEQEFGVLAFDPGVKKSICYVDGDISDWKNDKFNVQNEQFRLYIKSDEKYVYFMADIKNFNFDKDKFVIPIDITPDSGNLHHKEYNLKFQRPIDFLITIDKEKGSRVSVDAYYDIFYYIYSKQLKMEKDNLEYEKKNTGIFNPIYLCLNRELYLPQDKKTLPLSKYETGKFILGDGNPKHENYNSLTDYSVSNNLIEIRIPWQLLNVMDPSTKMVMADFYKNEIKPKKINGFYLSGILIRDNQTKESVASFYSWKEWETPVYHERLKPSYFILKEAFKKVGAN